MKRHDYRRIAIAVLMAIGLSACASAPPVPAQPIPIPVPVPVPVSHLEAVTVRGPDGLQPPGVAGQLVFDDVAAAVGDVRDGQVFFTVPADAHVGWQAWLHISAPGLMPFDVRVWIHDKDGQLLDQCGCGGEVHLESAHVDPSNKTLTELARIRGAMWSTRWDGGLGPRPGRPDNILATDFLGCFPLAERQRMIDIYSSKGYTHAVVGPLVDSDGYHGQYCVHDWRQDWDGFLDILQSLWDRGIAPVVFIHPDGWTFEQTRDAFTPLLQQPRAQRLIRLAVPHGWEPAKYEWSSCTWALYAQWARQVLPNALVGIHTVSDVDAPVGTDARCDDNGQDNAKGWARVVPFIHFWSIQVGPYETAPAADPTLAQNFGDLFRPTARGSYWQRFHAGYAGWPRDSAWGQGQAIRLIYAEGTAYSSYWQNLPEAAALDWGDLAIQAGSDGYLDGGRVEVPAR